MNLLQFNNNFIQDILNTFLENLYIIHTNQEQIHINTNEIQQNAYILYEIIINNTDADNLFLYNNIENVFQEFIIKYMSNKDNHSNLYSIMLDDLELLKNIMNTFYDLYLQFFEEYFIKGNNLTLIRDLYYKLYYENIYQNYTTVIYYNLSSEINNILNNNINVFKNCNKNCNLDTILKLINILEKYDNYKIFNTQIKIILQGTFNLILQENIHSNDLNDLMNIYKKQNYLYSYIFYHIDNNKHYTSLKYCIDDYYIGKHIDLLISQNVFDLILTDNHKELFKIIYIYIINYKKSMLCLMGDNICNYLKINLKQKNDVSIIQNLNPIDYIDTTYQFISEFLSMIDCLKEKKIIESIKNTLYKLFLNSNYIIERKINILKLLNIYINNSLIKNKINNNWINVFRYLLDIIYKKDEFIEYYNIYLKNRLLNKRTEYTAHNFRLENNVYNILASKIENQTDITEFILKDMNQNMNNDICILNKFHWKPNDKYILNTINKLPTTIQNILNKHTELYHSKYPNRKLNWDLIKSNITYNFMINNNKYKIQSCLLDFIIISFIYEKNAIHKNNIIDLLGIDEFIVDIHIDNLVVLNIIQIEKENVFLNKDIDKIPTNIIIPLPLKIEDKTKLNENKQYIFQNRLFVIQSNIIKLMKYNKKMNYLDLQNELIEKITLFKLDDEDLKLCIEKLINKDYIEKDVNNINILLYLD